MELKLTNPDDIGDYFEYLFDNNLISTYYPEVIIPTEEVVNSIQYTQISKSSSPPKSASPCPSKGRTRWSDKEKSILKSLIAVGYSLSNIADELDRTKQSVRRMASRLGYSYKSDVWSIINPLNNKQKGNN